MSAKDVFAQINIASPCETDWDSMIGNDRIRFCRHCKLSVHNLSEMTSKDVRRLVARSQGRLCVRYSALDRSVPAALPTPVLHRIGRRTSVLAAGAFSASLSLTNAIAGDLHNPQSGTYRVTALAATKEGARVLTSQGGTISGTIFDPNNAVIPGATVSLSNAQSKAAITTYTDDRGEYKFDGLEAGTYSLRVEASGFAPSDLPNITLRTGDENRIDQTLSIASIQAEVDVTAPVNMSATMGMVAMRSEPTEPLVKAAQEDDLDAVKEALLAQTNANVRDKSTGSNALEHAIQNANRDMVQVLLWAKADVNARNDSGQTVLMMLGDKITSDIVWDLINAGAKVNLRDNDGDTALIEAARSNNLDVLKTLLEAGAKVNAKNNDGQTPLMMAASEGLINNVKALILAGADINARDGKGKSSLMYAKENDHSPVVRMLRSYGADESEPEKKAESDGG
jgi:Carboxypeptidase regulatory-like domain/Ankyrin repeats (3 copies)